MFESLKQKATDLTRTFKEKVKSTEVPLGTGSASKAREDIKKMYNRTDEALKQAGA